MITRAINALTAIIALAVAMLGCRSVPAGVEQPQAFHIASSPSTAPIPHPDLPRNVHSKLLRASFGYPGGFIEGRFAPRDPDPGRWLADSIVLVEPRFLSDKDNPAALEVGKQPVITIRAVGELEAAVYESSSNGT